MDLGRYLALAGTSDGQPLRLQLGQVLAWTGAGNNSISLLGATVTNVRALSGLTFSPGDTVALLVSAGSYLAIGEVV